jgi:glycosyltransferase involved in cell wall biosynthesis
MARILFISNHAFTLSNFRLAVALHLRSEGHEVVFCGRADGHEAALTNAGFRFLCWDVQDATVNPLRELVSLKRLISLMHEVRPDLSLHYTIKGVVYGGVAARWLGIPYISFITGLGYAFINDGAVARLARQMYRFVLSTGRAVVFLNRDDLHEFNCRGLLGDANPVLMPGEGVDMQHFRPAPTGPVTASASGVLGLRVLFVGRLLVDKGVREFVECARIVRRRRPDIAFQLLGSASSSNPKAIASDELSAWSAEGVVEYLGEARDVRPFLANSAIVVLPSYREGLPRVLLEAAAMSRPVIATDVPGCREVVVHGETGLLVPARDAQALAAAILRLINLPQPLRETMGQRGRALVDSRFSDAQVFAVYGTLLATALQSQVAASS